MRGMKIASPAFQNSQTIPAKYTCDGEDTSPPLQLSDVPVGAKSLVLIMDDPDSPTGTWDHWVAFNIPFATTEFLEGSKSPGLSGKNTFETLGYGGPCPGSGEHRYFFKLYALDTQLDLKEGANKTEIEQAMKGHIIEQAEFMGRYSRS